jgi:hypothetical protein
MKTNESDHNDRQGNLLITSTYAVNEEFPKQNPFPHTQNVRTAFNFEFIDIIYNKKSPSQSRMKLWAEGDFNYGVFVESDIPFFLIDFGDGWELDVNINILKLANKNDRNLWFSINGGDLNMFLVDASSNILKSIRNIHFSRTDRIKQVLQRQEQRYENHYEVDLEIDKIYSKYSLRDMINRTKMKKIN